MRRRTQRWLLPGILWVAMAGAAAAAGGGSITDTTLAWPTHDQFVRVFSLRDYNTRVVMAGTLLLGAAGGLVGSFMLLRKKALLADAISHATLPGIALAFIVMVAYGASGKNLTGLLLGAVASGLAGMGLVILIRTQTRLKEDAALGVVLSVFFGLGIALLGVIQKMSTGSAAGLESFIYGKTASMLAADGWRVAAFAGAIAAISAAMFKEFEVLCFDIEFAKAQGWPVATMDALMMGMVVAVTVVGLQAVGLILVIALLIIPPAAARFWTEHLRRMVLLAAAIGGGCGVVGAGLSALLPRLPAGAVIVLVAAAVFLFSMLFGTARGVLVRWLAHRRLTRRVHRQHLLRALFELAEDAAAPLGGADFTRVDIRSRDLRHARSWKPSVPRRHLAALEREDLVQRVPGGVRLTADGLAEARRVVRNHRLWELYLITHADVAPSHVDRDADTIEHVLGRAMMDELEQILAQQAPEVAIPASPHPLGER